MSINSYLIGAMMACPLCEEKKYLTLRRDEIKTLSGQWQQQYGFNPFESVSLGGHIDKRSCIECGVIYFSPSLYGDALFYSKLSKNDWYYESDKWEFERAVELVKKFRPQSILEVGCGAGEFLQKIASGVDYSLGLDINESALALSREKGLNVSNESMHTLDKNFDMIVLFQVLEHLEDPGKTLKMLASKLNSNGVLVIAVPNPEGYLKDSGVVLLDMPPHHNTVWSKGTFDWLAKFLKMETVSYETEPLRYVHYQGFLSSFIARNTKNSFIRKLQQLLSKVFAPFLFFLGGNQITGQTHLVVLRKNL